MRRYEIDWIRNISIMMLFVYHTCAIFCTFGDFYIVSPEKNILADIIIVLMFVWYMPMLFFLAGASTYYSSKKRSFKEYIIERINKLFIPLMFGILFLVPPQAYLARLWRGESGLSYFEHLKYFFTNMTDFTGYDGAFSPAHLWFILYLFVVSIIGGIIVFKLFEGCRGDNLIKFLKGLFFNKLTFLSLLFLGIIADFFPSIMGKSIVGCLIVFIIGYLVYSDIKVLDKLISNRFKFLNTLILFSILGFIYIFAFRDSISMNLVWWIDSVMKNSVLISAVSSIVGFSSIHLNKNNSMLKYLNASAFPVYIIHQPILLGLSFVIMPLIKSTYIAMGLIIFISLLVTFLVFEVVKRIKIFDLVLGIK